MSLLMRADEYREYLRERARALGSLLVKSAGAPEPSYDMSGELYVSKTGWALLQVPNDLVHGAFDTLDAPGIEMPPGCDGGRFNAHISVIRKEELDRIGGPAALTERGHHYHYTLGRLQTVRPTGWPEMSRVWMFLVHSPELKQLRVSKGLPPLPDGDKPFHLTVAVRRKGVFTPDDAE